METFKYTKLAADSGKEGLIAIVIFLLVTGFVIYRLSGKTDGLTSKHSLIVIGFMMLCGGVMIKTVFTRLASSGAWEVTIDDQFLRWVAPQGIGKSFDMHLNKITMLRGVVDKDNNYENYELLLENGDHFELPVDIGLDFDDFSDALEKRGVAIEKTVEQTSE